MSDWFDAGDPIQPLQPEIDPEGYTRFGGDCICGPIYTYGGHCEPGGFDHDCPVHGCDGTCRCCVDGSAS